MTTKAIRPAAREDRLHVVIAGAGVAALEAVLALRATAEERVTIELLAPETEFTYRPLAVAEPFRVGEVGRFPLHEITDPAGATLRPGTLASVDPDLHVARTMDGEDIPYDVLLLALGGEPVEAVPGALTFRGPADQDAFAELLADARQGRARRIVFAVPTGAAWPLPLYELALLTQWHLSENCVGRFDVTIVTPEDAPLALFGPQVSEVVSELLDIRSIGLRTESPPVEFARGVLRVLPEGAVEADRVVALPRLEGIPVDGIPHDRHGFVEVDAYCGVRGLDDVYAAGDMTTFPVKQGGIATQQADAAASAIAVRAGAPTAPQPFRPIVRGLLLTGGAARFLRAEATGRSSTVDLEPLWWPPAKIVGRHLAPFLAEHVGIVAEPPHPVDEAAVPIDIELEFDEGVVRPLA